MTSSPFTKAAEDPTFRAKYSIGIIAAYIGVVTLIFVVFVAVRSYGTSFTGKTLWNWLQLLGILAIPVAVTFGTALFTLQ